MNTADKHTNKLDRDKDKEKEKTTNVWVTTLSGVSELVRNVQINVA